MMIRQSKIGSSLESKELVVFDILRDSKCTECGKELGKGDFLFMEGKHPVCLSCADFDHLIYLPRGDAALTRRAKKYSALSAIVVRFSRSRGRYERQGILVEEAALERAEQECLADAQQRARRRERDEVRRAEDDRKLAAHCRSDSETVSWLSSGRSASCRSTHGVAGQRSGGSHVRRARSRNGGFDRRCDCGHPPPSHAIR
jgi:hypothetical protein